MHRLEKIISRALFGIFLTCFSSLSGCDDSDCTGIGISRGITLSSKVQFGVEQRIQDEQIVNGQPLSLFVTRTGSVASTSQLYNNNRITANGTGGFSYFIPMFYPSDGTAVDFYALHPYSDAATLANPLSFAIQTDQTMLANYLNSDLLYGAKSNVSPQSGAIALMFNHRLSKLDFTITSRSTSIDLGRLTGITIQGVLPETSIDLRTGRRSAASGSPVTVQAYGSPSVSGVAGNQTVTGYTAIIVPQSIPGGQQLFGVMIDGQMMYHTLVDDFGFASGTKYSVMLDVSDTGVSLSSQIEDWVDGGTIGGPAGR